MIDENQKDNQLNWREVVELGIQPLDNDHANKDSEDEYEDQQKD